MIQALNYHLIVMPTKAGIHECVSFNHGSPIKAFGDDDTSILESLYKAQDSTSCVAKQLDMAHVFQVGIDGEYMELDLFQLNRPMIVPARTLLSQLV